MIGIVGLIKLLEMICGDDFFFFFLYCSFLYLIKFFIDIDLEYVYNGFICRYWVNDVFKELN